MSGVALDLFYFKIVASPAGSLHKQWAFPLCH